MAQCKAKSKRSGERCKKDAVIGFDVCHIHGGKTPVGIASPHTTSGRWSKHLPQGLIAAHDDLKDDPEIMSIRQDIRLLDTLLIANLKKLDSNESGEAWQLILKAIDAAEYAYDDDNLAGMSKAFKGMRDIVQQRIAHYATEEEIRSKLEQRRRMVETEKKLMLQDERAISVEKAMLLISVLLDSVKRNVSDGATLSAIQADFIQATARPDSERISSGD
jgi:hypothetical protein